MGFQILCGDTHTSKHPQEISNNRHLPFKRDVIYGWEDGAKWTLHDVTRKGAIIRGDCGGDLRWHHESGDWISWKMHVIILLMLMTTATKLNREGVSFIEKTHIVKRMSPKCHLKEDISRSFKLLTLPTPTQRRANTLTVIIDSTKPLVDDKWWPRGRHWKGKHNRRRARTREHAKRRRRMHTNLNANPTRTRRTQEEIEKGNARSKDILKKKNWWLWSLIKGNEDALHKKIQRQCSCSIQCQLHCSVVCGKICHIHANNLKLAIESRRKH